MAPPDVLRYVVPPEHDGDRLDKLVAAATGASRREARLLISTGRVRIAGSVTRILARTVKAGRVVEVTPAAEPRDAQPAPAAAAQEPRGGPELKLLLLDRHLVVVDKPAGLLSEHDRHGAPSVETLVPPLLAARRERGNIWLVHRLDAQTSGALLLARTPQAAERLGRAFSAGSVRKDYLCLCAGELVRRVEVNEPIARVKGTRHGVRADGKAAATEVIPLASGGGCTLVHCRPRTGRTHQIRVHMAHLGHPLLGDGLYGGPRYSEGTPPEAIGRTMLHAARLRFEHPRGGEPVDVAAPVPGDMAALARRLGVEAALERFASSRE